MKKSALIILIIIALVLATLGIFALRSQSKAGIAPKNQPQAEGSPRVKPSVILVLDDGQKVSTYSGIQSETAFEALKLVSEKANLPMVTKKYDFGIFVQRIGDRENNKNNAWIFFVNGKSADVAADKYQLKENDAVEWKYTTPIY